MWWKSKKKLMEEIEELNKEAKKAYQDAMNEAKKLKEKGLYKTCVDAKKKRLEDKIKWLESKINKDLLERGWYGGNSCVRGDLWCTMMCGNELEEILKMLIKYEEMGFLVSVVCDYNFISSKFYGIYIDIHVNEE